MFVTKKIPKRIIKLVFVILLFVHISDGAENDFKVSDDENQSGGDAFVAANKNEDSAENGENSIQVEDNTNTSKLDKSDKKPPIKDDDGKSESCNSIYGDMRATPIDARKDNTAEGSKQTSDVENMNNVDVKRKENNNLSGKTQDSNRKTSLDDVDSLKAAEDDPQVEKRDTIPWGNWGMPRDASYFFDDLEPFVDNNSDNRVGRAAPLHEPKLQKIKYSSKGKEPSKNDFDEEENEVENVETGEENVKEVDYEDEDDDEEEESGCEPTTISTCTTTSTCPTTTTTKTTCSTTTSCPTTKSSTVCKTPTQCKTTTKCPKLCAKANRKQIGYPVTTVNSFEWDSEKRKFNNKKRKYHSKITDVKN